VANLPAALRLGLADLLTDESAQLEAGLLARAQAQDGDAFRVLFDRHVTAVRRFLCDLLGDVSAADEATQETFVRAYDRLVTVRNGEKLRTWLLGIARNVALESFRARRRFRLSFLWNHTKDDDGEALEAASPQTPETLLMHRQALHHVSEALQSLHPDRRAALLLRFDHALPYEEISRVLGWSLSKAKVEVHRARLQLRRTLAHCEGDEP
jgi:RNA polymerase sigma-70 factor, ECF subfamily